MRRNWIKLYVDQSLRGSMMQELKPAERWVWIGLLLLAGDSPLEGSIGLTPSIGYTDQQLAELLSCQIDLIKDSKKKMIEYAKIEVDKSNIIHILNWKKYQSEYRRQRSYREKLQEEVTYESRNCSPSLSSLYSEIIKNLNERTGKSFSPDTIETRRLIKRLISDGRTLEDFKRVIDIKAKKWLHDPKMADYLRPSTLFRPTNFENYLQEKELKKKTREERAKEMTDRMLEGK